MDNAKNDKYYINRVFDDLAYIIKYMQGTQIETFSNNELLQDAMMFRLIQISENARKLSDRYREEHSMIPWTAIFGLRNRIVHDYGNVVLDVVYDTLKKDIPDLMNTMKENLD